MKDSDTATTERFLLAADIRFAITGRGVALMPEAPCFPRDYPRIRKSLRLGSLVTFRLRRPDGGALAAEGWVEFALYDSTRGDGIACVLKPGVPMEEIPTGTEVWLINTGEPKR
jgi:hypothetical protein